MHVYMSTIWVLEAEMLRYGREDKPKQSPLFETTHDLHLYIDVGRGLPQSLPQWIKI